LSIVAQIADAHHGTVTVGESSSGGARFVVRLPLAVDDTVSDTTNRLDTMTGER
jgi:signal transduction histidine kinase